MNANNATGFVIIAGEVSGDHHGARLVHALKTRFPEERIWGIGGDRMIREGFDAQYHVRQMAFLGIGEVIRHLPFIRRVLSNMTRMVKNHRPRAVILIDYPGFNLRFAAEMKKLQARVIYYISPQLWAWGRGRVKKIRRLVDLMLVVFPFEVDFYARLGIRAICVGHPLVDTHSGSVNPKRAPDPHNGVLGIMPGSRLQEVEQLFPDMLRAADMLVADGKVSRIVIAAVDHIEDDLYQKMIGGRDTFQLFRGALADFYNCLDAALVSSGTATLETAYFRVPLVIVYRVNFLTWLLGKMLIKLKYIGLANIVAGEKIAVELIQQEFTAERAAAELLKLLEPQTNRQIRDRLWIIQDKLGVPGASERAAAEIEKFIRKRENTDA